VLLAIDTATRFLSVALHDGQTLLGEHTAYSHNQHTVQLAPLVELLVKDTGASFDELTAVAVAQGPGSFSGLRIGFGLAKGIVSARRLPLAPIPTLDIVAQGTPRTRGGLLAVMQAGRGRFYAGHYRWSKDGWHNKGEAFSTTWEELLPTINGETLISGEIDLNWRNTLAEHDQVRLTDPVMSVRRAGHLATLGWEAVLNGNAYDDPAGANPIYLKARQ
jgi:tRNA threonylcarbamoyladenosine biosynthesis protein TsaB